MVGVLLVEGGVLTLVRPQFPGQGTDLLLGRHPLLLHGLVPPSTQLQLLLQHPDLYQGRAVLLLKGGDLDFQFSYLLLTGLELGLGLRQSEKTNDIL